MVSRYHPEVPVAVVRPSIVVSTASEPLVGWGDNINGPTGVLVGSLLGVLRVWQADPKVKADMIPVDIANNTMIAVGWHVAAHRPKPDTKIVFNSVSSIKKPITWKQFMDGIERTGFTENISTMKAVGIYSLTITKNAALLYIYTLWFHFIPGLFCDMLMSLAKMKPQFLYAYRKIYIANRAVAPFSINEVKFVDDNSAEVFSIMNAKDRQLFNFDLNSFTYPQLFRNYVKGTRVYLLNDPIETLPQARKRYWNIYYFTLFVKATLFFIGGWVLYSLLSAFLKLELSSTS